MIPIGIIGVSGYTGLELIKLIANHQKEYKMIRKQLASQKNIELNSKTDVINK